jgi:hypothetical protein
MILISHRGNIIGSCPDKENRPSYIDCAIQLGLEVEVDIRFVNNDFWLGHDYPQYRVDISWMRLRKHKIWFHCKDQDSASQFLLINEEFKFFCHTNDDFVLTSNGYLWIHDLKSNINKKCIVPLISKNDILKYDNLEPSYICTDFVYEFNSLKNE